MAVGTRESGAQIQFSVPVSAIGQMVLLRLPDEASSALPSRGQVAVRGRIDGRDLRTVVEPDGRGGHWMRVDPSWEGAARIRPGDTVHVTLEVAEDWPEPEVPPDLETALAEAPAGVRGLWDVITPMARWEWVRWVKATKSPATRQRRVEVSISKLDDGKRRPCCFDLSACTDPEVSRSGKLVPEL
jgi:hypothetical protein